MTSDSREHSIREMAYSKWELAGCPSGDGIQFWLEAEKELCLSDEATAGSPKSATLSSLRAVEPPPLKLNKSSGASRKKAG